MLCILWLFWVITCFFTCSQFVLPMRVACIKVLCIYMHLRVRSSTIVLHFSIFYLTLPKFNMKPFQNMMVLSTSSLQKRNLLGIWGELKVSRICPWPLDMDPTLSESRLVAQGAPCDGKLQIAPPWHWWHLRFCHPKRERSYSNQQH